MTRQFLDSLPFVQSTKSHRVLSNIALALLYWGIAEIGFLLAQIHGNVSPIWPPSGLAIAAVLIGRHRLLPGIFVGALLANAFTGINLLSVFTIAMGNTMEAALALTLLRLMRPAASSTFLGDYFTPSWLLLSSLLAPIFSASIGSLSIYFLNPSATSTSFLNLWLTWWAGDAIGILIVAPALLSLRVPAASFMWWIKAGVLSTLCLTLFSLIFFHDLGAPLLFLALPPLLLACHWFGPAGCAWTVIAFVAFATSATLIDATPLASTHMNEHILVLNVFLLSLAITSLAISTFYRKGAFLIPALLFLSGWLLSGALFHSLRSASQDLNEAQFLDIVYDSELAVENRLNTYVDALIASAGMYLNSDELRRDQWRNFVNNLELQDRYPGINGLGFVQAFNPEELAASVDLIRASDVPDFTVKNVPRVTPPPPDELGNSHYIITYIEPIEANRQALGLNLASETNRQDAARRARDSGIPVMTDRIVLVQDGKKRPGFLIYYPMYRPGMPTDTTDQRRLAFVGWSYAPFITELFLEGVLGNRADQIDFEVFDAPLMSPNNFVYSTQSSPLFASSSEKYDHTSTLNLAGQTFRFGWKHGKGFQTHETAAATITAASLALGTCLIVGIVVNLQSTNRRANEIVRSKTAELTEANNQLQREVYDRKKAEAAAKHARHAAEGANMAKSEFLAIMSHEIRTPMNSVLGFAELLTLSDLTSEQNTWTDYIQSSGLSLLRIIDDILDFSKMEAGKLELERIAFDPVESAQEVILTFSKHAEEKGLTIELRTAKNFPSNAYGDPIRYKQVLTNLIGNALKFTERGGIIISMLWDGDIHSGIAHLRIADTGIGIPADKVGSLFGEFTQMDSSTTRRFGGTGLGLAICKRIINLMDGDIWAESVLDQGTTIGFDVPLSVPSTRDPEIAPPEASSPTPAEAQKKGTGLEVLLVDDQKINQQLGLTILRRIGCSVLLASDGLEALETLKQQHVDIVFMDCQMPEMDGYEATRRIREMENQGTLLHRHAHPLTIVAITANATDADKINCLECGMDDYISKPCSFKDFTDSIDAHIEKSTQHA